VLLAAVAAVSLHVPVAQADWLPPVEISEAGEHAGSPHVALDSEGNATAVWDRWNGVDTVVESAFRPAGKSWGPPENLSEPEVEGEFLPGAHDAQSPQVVVDRNGNLTVIWERYAWPKTIIQAVEREPGGSWTAPADIAEFNAGFSPEPWLAVDWEGNATAVWKQGEVIWSSFRPFAGAWQEPVSLSSGESFVPQAAMDARGDATAVWMHFDGSHYVVESAYRPEQGEWEEPTLVSQPGEEGGNPHVAIDAKGDSLVVWRGEDEGTEFVRAAYRPVGGSWSKPVDVSTSGEQVQSLHAAVDPEGNAIVAWAGGKGKEGEWEIVHAAFKATGGGWETPVELSAEGGNGFPSDVVFDQSGNAALIWQRWDGVTNLAQASYRPAGGEWEPAMDLSEEGEQAMDAVVVLDAPGDATAADGDATAVWVGATPIACSSEKESPCYSYVVKAAGYDPDGVPTVEVEAPEEAETGESVEFEIPTEGLYSPELEFGDGGKAGGTAAVHVYADPGEYEVTAAGAEELGYRGSVTRTIKIVGEGTGEGGEGEPEEESGGAGGQGGAPPLQGEGSPPIPSAASDQCDLAKAARDSAVATLRKVNQKLALSSSVKAHRRLRAVKRKRLASLRRARARVAAAC